MEIVSKRITVPSRSTIVKLYFIADCHIGNKGCSYDRISRDVCEIKNDPFSYWIGGGDYIDAVTINDKRFDPQSIPDEFLIGLDDLPDKQIERFMQLLDPIKDKCIGLHRGNHEEKVRQYLHRDIIERVCNEWKVPNLNDIAFVKLFIERCRKGKNSREYVVCSAHGNVAGRRGGSKINKLEDLVTYFDADIYMLAHGHKKVSHKSSRLSVNKANKLESKQKIGFMTGAYLKTYQEGTSTYAEKGLYAPSDIGAVYCAIDKEHNDIRVIL